MNIVGLYLDELNESECRIIYNSMRSIMDYFDVQGDFFVFDLTGCLDSGLI